MKAFTNGKGFANWLLRLSLVGIILIVQVPEVLDLNLSTLPFYFALIETIAAIFLFVGGFSKSQSITVISALILVITLFIVLIESWPGTLNTMVLHNFLLFSVGFYFLTNGNRK
jgi:hypothetical protein